MISKLSKTTFTEGSKFTLILLALTLLAFMPEFVMAHGMSEDEKQAIIDGGNWQYLWLGATHMLSGYDHLAFVFGIIFFLTSFKDIAKYVTAFTLGHSVTLIFATFNSIQLNYFLIDAVIALSVCYIAFSNLDGFRKYLKINPPNMMAMIVGLGLIHGFGLSTRLQELPLSQDHLLMNIISFNVGIELGQITALGVMLIVITAWRKAPSFKPVSLGANYALITMGIYLFFMQMHGYEHTANEELASLSPSSVVTQAVAFEAAPPQFSEDVSEDTVEVIIPARGELEYKLFVQQGQSFKYHWKRNGKPLFFDLHGEPASNKTGDFQSYKKGTEAEASGVLTALFSGTHGWYWKNNSNEPALITLKLEGGYELPEKLATEKPKTQAKHDSL